MCLLFYITLVQLLTQNQILTGATGSLGAHILAQMVNNDGVNKVYCLVRGRDPMSRVLTSLKERGIELAEYSLSKVVAYSADFGKSDLGLGEEMIEQFKKEVSLIIHFAWPVNFAIHLPSFEAHIKGLQTLLALSLAVERKEPARVFFASSITTAEGTPPPALIPDAPIEDFNQALEMGYAQSKLVGEHIILNAARAGARSYILRIGQIVGDRNWGLWNVDEFIPLTIRSAVSMKLLPIMNEDCSWIPVDTLATAILEIDQKLKAGPRPNAISNTNPPVIYNMVNPRLFPWNDMLEELHVAGLDFKAVPYIEWLQKLREDAANHKEAVNPAVKLLVHFEQRYVLEEVAEAKAKLNGTKSSGASSPNGSEWVQINGSNSPTAIIFDTKAALRDSTVLRNPPDIIKDGYIGQFLYQWRKKWAESK